MAGIEPACRSAGDFKSPVYTCFTTLAHKWWVVTGSNRRQPACKAGTLPTELTTLDGDKGLEPLHDGIKIRCLTNLANPQLLENKLVQTNSITFQI